MKWLVIVLAVIAGLVVVVTVVGYLIPREHQAARSVLLRQPLEVVWAAITKLEEQPAWRTGLERIEMLPPRDGKPCYREHGKHGALTMVIEKDEPPFLRIGRIVDESSFGGTWTFALREESGGTRLTITEGGWIANPVFRTLARFAFGYEATLTGYLADLGRKLGESVVIEPATGRL